MAALDEGYAPLTFNIHSDPETLLNDFYGESTAALGIDKCLPYFEERGIDLTQYNTHNTVLDAIALMRHLNYPTYNLYGASYGTRIAQKRSSITTQKIPPQSCHRFEVWSSTVSIRATWSGWKMGTFNPISPCVSSQIARRMRAVAPLADIRQRLIDLLAKMEEAPLTTDNERRNHAGRIGRRLARRQHECGAARIAAPDGG
ncbi:MAG: hypothetical protein R2911_21265 [Caldilineaceae bacterium]